MSKKLANTTVCKPIHNYFVGVKLLGIYNANYVYIHSMPEVELTPVIYTGAN